MLVHESMGFDGLEDLGKFKIKKLAQKIKGGMLFPKGLRRKHLGWKTGHPAAAAPAAPAMPVPAAPETMVPMYATPTFPFWESAPVQVAPEYMQLPSQEILDATGCYPYGAGEAVKSGYVVRTYSSPTGLVQYACPRPVYKGK